MAIFFTDFMTVAGAVLLFPFGDAFFGSSAVSAADSALPSFPFPFENAFFGAPAVSVADSAPPILIRRKHSA